MNIEDMNKQIAILEEKRNFLQRIKKIKTEDINLIIYIKYIQIEHVKEVAKEINEMGYRIETEHSNRKYTSDDISKIIKTKNLINDDEIDSTAKGVFYNNKKKASRLT